MIQGANSQRYTVASADVGHRLRVDVTAHSGDGTGTARSQATGVVQAAGSAPANKALPAISGAAQEGSVLSVSNGSWNGTQPISYAYAWQRCDAEGGNCATISGSSSSKYTLASGDVGHTVRAGTDTYGHQLYGEEVGEADLRVIDALENAAQQEKVPPAQMALAWLLQKPSVIAPIVGVSKPGQLDQALAALEMSLSADVIRQLEEPYVPHPVAGI